MGVTLNDLRAWQQADRVLPDGRRFSAKQPVLYCAECDGRYSAMPADYWQKASDEEFTCCNEPMSLVFERTVMVEVEKNEAFTRLVDALRAS